MTEPTPAPPPPPGDDKDWTWVLDRVCPECRFDTSDIPPWEYGDRLLSNALSWRDVLARDETALRHRPHPERWSTLEYACHVRDVIAVYHTRIGLMLTEDGPHYPNWDQDATAIEERYDLADPVTVGQEIVAGAGALADVFGGIDNEQWQRTGHRSDGASFTVETIGRYFLHDLVHHLHDVKNGPAAA